VKYLVMSSKGKGLEGRKGKGTERKERREERGERRGKVEGGERHDASQWRKGARVPKLPKAADVRVLLAHSDHHALVARAAHDGGEDRARRVVIRAKLEAGNEDCIENTSTHRHRHGHCQTHT